MSDRDRGPEGLTSCGRLVAAVASPVDSAQAPGHPWLGEDDGAAHGGSFYAKVLLS